jgi:hypothetical protein
MISSDEASDRDLGCARALILLVAFYSLLAIAAIVWVRYG